MNLKKINKRSLLTLAIIFGSWPLLLFFVADQLAWEKPYIANASLGQAMYILSITVGAVLLGMFAHQYLKQNKYTPSLEIIVAAIYFLTLIFLLIRLDLGL